VEEVWKDTRAPDIKAKTILGNKTRAHNKKGMSKKFPPPTAPSSMK
jgi:hypothetical protein